MKGDRINMTLRVSYDTVRYAAELRERGVKVNELVERHIAKVEEQIASLQTLKAHLETLCHACSGDHGHSCGIIDSLAHGSDCPCCEGLHCRLRQSSGQPPASE